MSDGELRKLLECVKSHVEWHELVDGCDVCKAECKRLDTIISELPDDTCSTCGGEMLRDGDDFLCEKCEGIAGEIEKLQEGEQ